MKRVLEMMEFLRKVNCTDFENFVRILEENETLDVFSLPQHRQNYFMGKFEALKENLFKGLCELDDPNLIRLWDALKEPQSVDFIRS